MSSSAEYQSDRTIPRLVLVVLYVLGVAVAAAPYPALARSPLTWMITVAAMLAVGFLTTRRLTTFSGQVPSRFEIVLSVFGVSLGGAAGALLGTILLTVGNLVVSLFTRQFDNAGVNYFASCIFAAFSFLYVIGSVPTSLKSLYPQAPGRRSPLYRPASQANSLIKALTQIGAALACSAAAVVAALFLPAPSTVAVGLAVVANLVVLGTGSGYAQRESATDVAVPEALLSAAAKLLEAAGFAVTLRPRVGDEATDAVISLLDFIAVRPDRALAGCVRPDQPLAEPSPDGRRSAPRSLLSEVAGLESAVHVLMRKLQEQKNVMAPMTPVLLVLGDEDPADVIPERPELLGELRIIVAPSEPYITKLASQPGNALRELAADLFGVSPEARVA